MKFNNHLKNNKGYLLIWTLIVMVVLVILGMSILNITSAEINHTSRSEKQIQVDYIARAGTEDAFYNLKNVTSYGDYDTEEDLVNSLTNPTTLSPIENGSYIYSYNYDSSYPKYIKITSQATHLDGKTDSTVSLYVIPEPAFTTDGWLMPPESWMRAMNLNPDVDPEIEGDDATGSLVNFNDYTKSPQNDDNLSTFRATVIRFTGLNNKGVTFEQIPNTNDITFDAEIIIFGGDIYLNDDTRELNLGISGANGDDKGVLSGDVDHLVPNLTYSGEFGFEDLDRYLDFIGETEENSYYNSYGFDENTHYGLVSFGGNIEHKDKGTLLDNRESGIDLHDVSTYDLYFYPNTTNLNDETHLDKTHANYKLIPIDNNDPIRNVISTKMGIQKYTLGDKVVKKIYVQED